RHSGRAVTAPDGSYHLDELPPGAYTLVASLPGAGGRYGTRSFKVTLKARTGRGGVTPVCADVALPPTLLQGRVTGPGGVPVAMAEVSLRGAAQSTRTAADGRWVLAGVEPGARQVRVAARGFKPAARAVSLGDPGAAATVDVELVPA
ncbi:MAG TPA: carboxypeptidase regulatory-like domain-containing protein, partial [Longimicrobiaceae bacterium]